MLRIKDRMTTPILLIQTVPVDNNGWVVYEETENTENAWCVWKNYGGTETTSGTGKTTVVDYDDTATIQMRYTPFLKQYTHVKNLLTGLTYRVITVPDNINQLNQYLVFKVQKVD